MQTERIVNHITNWLKDYCLGAGTKGFVVGVSGGIDSAVVSALAARTGLPTLCLELPIHQSEKQVSRARKHIAFLESKHSNVCNVELELTPVFDQFMKALPAAETEKSELAMVNTRSRLRMTALYHFATMHSYLVVGTGNKVEDFGVGFFTKYGDGGVDLSPIADLMKTEVYALGKFLGVHDDIMIAPPTDGLWGDDRSDEDQIGASYPELEWAMTFSGSEAELTPRQKEVLAIYRRLNRINQHKMKPIPVCMVPEEWKQ
jgi:NAD+ synthase